MNDHPYIEQMPSSGLKAVDIRHQTDRKFVLLLPINLMLWFGLGIYYVYTDTKIMYIVPHSGLTWFFNAILGTATVFFVILLAFISNKWRIKIVFIIISYIAVISAILALGIFYQLLTLLGYIWNKFEYGYHLEYQRFFPIIVLLILCIIWLSYYLTIFFHTKKADSSLLTQIINKPSRAILGSLPTLLFSTLIVTSSTIIFIFSWNWFHEQQSVEESAHSFWFWLPAFIFIFVGTFVSNFIWNFGFTVMGDYFAHYYSNSGIRKEICVLESITRIMRYHFGTIALLSTPILPSAYALVTAFKTNHEHGQQSRITIMTNFFSKVCLILDISDYASMQVSMYGHSALKSIKEIFELHQSNSVLFLVTNAASQKLVEISTACTIIIGSILISMTFRMFCDLSFLLSCDNLYYYMGIITLKLDLVTATMSVNLMSKFLIRPAMCIFSIHKMASLRESAALEESCRLQDLPKE